MSWPARFDDLSAGAGWCFGPPVRVLAARSVGQVRGVLRAVQAATEAGCWAYGYVGFEAGAAFDAAFPHRTPAQAGDLPLAWFAISGPPTRSAAIGPPVDPAPAGSWTPDWSAGQFAGRVAAIRAVIAAGGVYQCNLTTRLRGPAPADPLATYAGLAHAQRGAYNAYLDLGDQVIVCASPELFVEWTDHGLRCAPMKGTAARGEDSGTDGAQRDRLRASGKERAENVMIVDLIRNDLARIAATGTVEVPELCRAERYETVWQLTSEVTAQPRPGTSLEALFAALFPPGSVTGAPKAAALRLIHELEDTPRGVYCGTIGMLAPPGAAAFRARFAVAIRTLVIDRPSGTAVYGTGAGITWGSDPAAEYAETILKSAVLASDARPFQLLETMRYQPGRGVWNLDRHLARLACSAGYFGYRYDEPAVRAALATLDKISELGEITGPDEIGVQRPWRVRLLLARDGTTTVEHEPFAVTDPGPVRLAVDPPGPPPDRWSRHKTTRRDRYTAAAARHPDADDVILTDPDGHVLETTIGNLAAHLDGTWCTPPAARGCLPGVERARLLDTGLLAERDLTADDLRNADGLAVLNSLRGWRPANLQP